MSINLNAAAVEQFDAEVKHVYQGMQTLRNTVSLRTNVVGDVYNFTRMGKGLALQKASQADVTPMDISHARQAATLGNWYASEYTDIFDQQEVNFSEVSELSKTIGKGLGRRDDQVILDVFSGVTYASTNDEDPDTGFLVDVATNFSLDTIRSAVAHLDDIEADEDNRHIVLRTAALHKLLEDPEVTSADYNSIRALINGDLDSYYGLKFHKIGTRGEGGIDIENATNHHAYVYHGDSVGLAVGIDIRTEVNYIPQKTSWLSSGLYKAGAVAREPQGIVRIKYDPTA